MNELTLYLIAGVVLLLLFLFWFLRGRPGSADREAPLENFEKIVSLQSVPFDKAHLVFDPADYKRLHSIPRLRPLARQLRRDRREMALLWLASMQEDVRNLWRFRRLLVRNGVSTTLGEEARVGAASVLALFALLTLRFLVLLAGPFVLPPFLLWARRRVEATRTLCAELLSRVPRSSWPEIESQWVAEFSGTTRD
ncbi:MAG: hypothetical protein ACE5HB_09185 [Terriglobia bacterium]